MLLFYFFLISYVSQMILYNLTVWINIEKLVVLLDLIFQWPFFIVILFSCTYLYKYKIDLFSLKCRAFTHMI